MQQQRLQQAQQAQLAQQHQQQSQPALNEASASIQNDYADSAFQQSGFYDGQSSNGLEQAESVPGIEHSDPYGLLGLLKVLNMSNRDLNILASGIDLTTLGLNLMSDTLYPTFASPFSDMPLKREPEFQIPNCYFLKDPLLPPLDKMSLFTDETLFYIFYSMPKDSLQMAAANELMMRDWSYHTELKVWFQRAPGIAPVVKTQTYENGSYIYFDNRNWKEMQRNNFHMEYDKLFTLPQQ